MYISVTDHGIGVVNLQVQDRRSNYNGMQLTLSKRYSHGFQVTSTYTLSKVEGDFAGERQNGGERKARAQGTDH